MGNVGKDIEKIAFFGIDNLLHLGHLRFVEAFFGRPCKSFARVSGALHRARSSASSLKNSGSLEFLRRHRLAVGVPKMRSLEVAVTSYSLDHPPHMGDGFEIGGGEGIPYAYSELTTPHAYLTPIPFDEFLPADRAPDNGGNGAGPRDPSNNVYRFYAAYWRYLASGNSPQVGERCGVSPDAKGVINSYPFDPVAACAGRWIVVSAGPDQSHRYGEWIMHKAQLQGGNPRVYSPTNGTVSYGDIARWGS
jgi:hypothetical protein